MNAKRLVPILWSGILAATGTSQAQPPAPATCSATPGLYAGALVTWTDVAGETGYRIYRDGTPLTTTGAGVTGHLDLEVPGPGTYTYCVEAVNASGASSQCCSVIVFPTPPIMVEPKHWFHDTFTSNDDVVIQYPYTAFDTTSAWIRTGLNLAQLTGDASRQDLPGDTLVASAPGAGLRLDLVFRIVPGVGNYVTIGNRNSGLRRVPTSNVPAVSNAGSANFWESFLADNGAVGTGGNGTNGPGHPLGKWDPNRWNSARCDTAETNIFPVESLLPNMPALTPGRWASMYHEADLKYLTLGVPKNRCFLVDPGGAINSTNITCGAATFPPPWTSGPSVGMTPSEGGLPAGVTREFSQIIPDGQLTPGSHVEYFLRVSDENAPQSALGMTPDTSIVVPQPSGSLDAARWAQFGVLPDHWKSPQYGGRDWACMLVVDLDDGRGNEAAWVTVADSFPTQRGYMTLPPRRGAHNGWAGAPWGADPNDPAYFVRVHGGQPGSAWDLYSVRGSRDTLTGNAGSIGGRLAPRCTNCPSSGRESRQGPTLAMLRQLYQVVLILTGDRSNAILGPLTDRGQADVNLLQDFLAPPLPPWDPGYKYLHVQGSGFAQSEAVGHPTFLRNYMGVSLRGDYVTLSGNTNPGVTFSFAMSSYIQFGLVPKSLDVLNIENPPFVPGHTLAFSTYEPVGTAAPYVAGVRRSQGAQPQWSTQLDGFDIADLRLTNWISKGRVDYFDLIGSCAARPGLGVPQSPEQNRPSITLTNNPLVRGSASVRLALERAERVKVAVYDIAGRQIRVLVDGPLLAGDHEFWWDGSDAESRSVANGVYLIRTSTASGVRAAKSLVVLR